MSETEQTYLSLVWATKPCKIGPYHKRHYGEGGCDSTGLVLLLPDLSEGCRCTWRDQDGGDYPKHPDGCVCHGTGRVPKPIDGFLLIDTLQPHYLEIVREGLTEFACRLVFYADSPSGYLDVKAKAMPSRLEALIEAAWQAVQARYPQEGKREQELH